MVCLLSGIAQAQEATDDRCESSVECPTGLICDLSHHICVFPSCTTDKDCQDGLVCVETNYEICNTKGCHSESNSYCVPKYVAPCSEDKDCGDKGFSCVQAQSCKCLDSGCTKTECTLNGYCELNDQDCSTYQDCLKGDGEWSCEIFDNCDPKVDLNCVPGMCTPPYWQRWGQTIPLSSATEAKDGDVQQTDNGLNNENTTNSEMNCASFNSGSMAWLMVAVTIITRNFSRIRKTAALQKFRS